jgi:hypothetical protein
MDFDHDVIGGSWIYVVNIQIPDILQVEKEAPLEKHSFVIGQDRTIRWSSFSYAMSHHSYLLLQLHQLRL